MRQKLYHFLIYGFAGWMIEIIFTGTGSILRGDPTLVAWTYLWMFPIYGMAVFLEPVHDRIRSVPWWIRGIVWTGFIFILEYFSGLTLRTLTGLCPWDYGHRLFSMDGLIRLDYAPFWFFAGLGFERLHDLMERLF
ncbi:putative ABC transporter permease [Thermoanaerobacterium sp. DL9XJH110]|uniref:putative ABC transporter permease n=1 Tax=Thermoanaerobacterium sp. DL9XJH110 TaxID=3386643 RepID=UPI003BB4E0FB